MKTRLSISSLPPSVNHIYRHTRKGTFKTAAYNTWANAVGYEINRQMAGQPKWNEPVFVRLAMKRPRTNTDIDNRLKGFGDLLQAHGVVTNDKLIHGWNAFWHDGLPTGVAAYITIVPVTAVSRALRTHAPAKLIERAA